MSAWRRLTSNPADVQDVSDDAVGDVGGRLGPRDLQGAGGQAAGRQALWGRGQVFGVGHGQTGAGLVGSGAVFGYALVDGLIV